MRFGTWNVRSVCRAGSLKPVARELGKYRRGMCNGFDGKARRKETTWKTKAQMGGWDQNGS
jgi:hypothetical protein